MYLQGQSIFLLKKKKKADLTEKKYLRLQAQSLETYYT